MQTTRNLDGRTYDEAVAGFDLEALKADLHGDLDRGANACVECCDRHAGQGRTALRFVSPDGQVQSFSFDEIAGMSARMANLLTEAGIGAGDVVAGLLPRTPDLLATILGVWRAGAVYQPLFTAFGPKAIEQRIGASGAKLIVTDTANRPKLDDVADAPRVATIAPDRGAIPSGDIDFLAAMARQGTSFDPVPRKGSDPMMLLFTSGTTGAPKGVVVPISALLSFAVYMRDAIDLREGDTYWNIADPGWAYGLYYAVAGPLLLGQATTFYPGGFTPQSTCDVIEALGVNNLAGAPTAYRMLMAAENDVVPRLAGKLRVVHSAGEPLNPEVIRWFDAKIGAPIRDHYGQTETGMLVNNHHGIRHEVTPGTAGRAMPGYRVAVLGDDGQVLEDGTPGTLAVDVARSPLMWFRGYLGQGDGALAGGYYRTGDTVERAADGTISFVGRSDDVITSSGYRIGPFDVESALLEHPSVIEAAVVGVPDPTRTELVKAFVVLADPGLASDALAEELQRHVKDRLAAHAFPRLVEFVTALPKTPSGKIQRFLLRQAGG